MRIGFIRLSGVVILIGAIIGLVFSIYGLYAIWTIKSDVTTSVVGLVSLSSRTLDATDSMLMVVSNSLDEASEDLGLIHEILDGTSQTIGETTSLIDDTAALMGNDMSGFITETQASLTGLQSTARLIDDTLGTISRIPLLGPFLTSRYTPEIPLHTSVEQVNRSLDPLSESFTQIQRDLEIASSSFDTIGGEVEALSEQIDDIETSIDEARFVVDRYTELLDELRQKVNSLEKNLPVLIDTTYLALTLVLVWLGVSQLGSLLHALQMLALPYE